MTPQRNSALLKGQTSIAQKVYQAIPAAPATSATVLEIAQAMKAATGATADIHIMRGCLSALKDTGLIKEVVPGSFRQVEVKEKTEMSKVAEAPKLVVSEPIKKVSADPMDVLGDLSGRLRGLMASMARLADDIDSAAISIGERAGQNAAELAKVKQIATLLKELG